MSRNDNSEPQTDKPEENTFKGFGPAETPETEAHSVRIGNAPAEAETEAHTMRVGVAPSEKPSEQLGHDGSPGEAEVEAHTIKIGGPSADSARIFGPDQD